MKQALKHKMDVQVCAGDFVKTHRISSQRMVELAIRDISRIDTY